MGEHGEAKWALLQGEAYQKLWGAKEVANHVYLARVTEASGEL